MLAQSSRPSRTAGFIVCLGAFLQVGLSAATPARSADPDEIAAPDEMPQLISEMGTFYSRHPELAGKSGTGWKPFQRMKWDWEERLVDGQGPAPGAGVAAHARMVELEARHGAAERSQWFCRGPENRGGRVFDFDFDPVDPSIIYATASSGGLWKSTNSGDSWLPLTDDLPTLHGGGVCVLPWNRDVILMGTGEATHAGFGVNVHTVGFGMFKSSDAGATWNQTGLSTADDTSFGFYTIQANPTTHTILAGTSSGLWRSTDDGDTWTAVKTNGHYHDVLWKPGDPNRVYTVKGHILGATTNNGVKVSTDDGLTWTGAGTGQPASNLFGRCRLALDPSNPSSLYLAVCQSSNFNFYGLYRTTDDATTWSLVSNTTNFTGTQGWRNLAIAVDPDDPDRIVIGGVFLYASTDGGSTWDFTDGTGGAYDDNLPHADYLNVRYEPGSNSNLWVANDGGLWRSTDDGATWLRRTDGLASYLFYDICVAQSDPSFLMGGTQDNGTDRWSGTTQWTNGLGGDGMVCNIKPGSANVIYAETQNGTHFKSVDGGANWNQIMGGITGDGLWVTPVDEDRNVAKHLYTSTSAGVFRTTQAGLNWTNVDPNPARWISISRVDGNIVWAMGTGGRVRRTTDDGGSWVLTADIAFPHGTATKIHAHPTDAGTALVTYSGYGAGLAHIVRTTDSGASWQDVTGDFVSQPVNAIALDPLEPNHWYIGADLGVWTSTDDGATWLPFQSGLPNVMVRDLEIQESDRKLVAGTYGRGVWESTLPTTTAVPLVGAATPGLLLDAPRPNPVRDVVEFRFASKNRAAPLRLEIFDVRGRLVSRVADRSLGDGIIRTAQWIAADVPSGVYFAVLTAGGDSMSRTIVVAK